MEIQKRTIVALRTITSKCFKNDDQYHDWLADNYGLASTKDLSEQEGREAITLLLKAFGDGKRLRINDSDEAEVGNWLSEDQEKYIKRLEKELGWKDNKSRLLGFIKRQTGLNKSARMLSVRDAQKVITGMLRLLKIEDQVNA